MYEVDSTLEWLDKIGAAFDSPELKSRLEAAGYTRSFSSVSDNGSILVVVSYRKDGCEEVISYFFT